MTTMEIPMIETLTRVFGVVATSVALIFFFPLLVLAIGLWVILS